MIQRFTTAAAPLALLLAGCASHGPLIPAPPTVRVTEIEALLVTPQEIEFQAQVEIENRMGARLEFTKVDWGVDLHDRPIFTECFTELNPLRARGRNTVTFPFRIVMSDILDRAVDVLAEEGLRLKFRGEVFPVGFAPVPFCGTRTFPLPRPPLVTVEGAQGSLLEGVFTVFLGVKNPNRFPLIIEGADTYLSINGTRYGLLRKCGAAEAPPGGSARVALTLEVSAAKTLSAILNLTRSRAPRLAVGGSFTCRAPFTVINVPVELELTGTSDSTR